MVGPVQAGVRSRDRTDPQTVQRRGAQAPTEQTLRQLALLQAVAALTAEDDGSGDGGGKRRDPAAPPSPLGAMSAAVLEAYPPAAPEQATAPAALPSLSSQQQRQQPSLFASNPVATSGGPSAAEVVAGNAPVSLPNALPTPLAGDVSAANHFNEPPTTPRTPEQQAWVDRGAVNANALGSIAHNLNQFGQMNGDNGYVKAGSLVNLGNSIYADSNNPNGRGVSVNTIGAGITALGALTNNPAIQKVGQAAVGVDSTIKAFQKGDTAGGAIGAVSTIAGATNSKELSAATQIASGVNQLVKANGVMSNNLNGAGAVVGGLGSLIGGEAGRKISAGAGMLGNAASAIANKIPGGAAAPIIGAVQGLTSLITKDPKVNAGVGVAGGIATAVLATGPVGVVAGVVGAVLSAVGLFGPKKGKMGDAGQDTYADINNDGIFDKVYRDNDNDIKVRHGQQGKVALTLDESTLGTTWDRGNVLAMNQILGPGQTMTSANGRFMAKMQEDGNLAVYDKQDANKLVWQSNTAGFQASSLMLGGDGNLVTYRPSPEQGKFYAAWNSKSVAPPPPAPQRVWVATSGPNAGQAIGHADEQKDAALADGATKRIDVTVGVGRGGAQIGSVDAQLVQPNGRFWVYADGPDAGKVVLNTKAPDAGVADGTVRAQTETVSNGEGSDQVQRNIKAATLTPPPPPAPPSFFLMLQDDGSLAVHRGTGPANAQGSVWASTGNTGEVIMPSFTDVVQKINNKGLFDRPSQRSEMEVKDFDGDGLADLRWKGDVLLNDGSGKFGRKVARAEAEAAGQQREAERAAQAAQAARDHRTAQNQIVDLTGNGIADFVRRDADSDNAFEIEMGRRTPEALQLDETTVSAREQIGSEMRAGQVLVPGQRIVSDNGRFIAQMEANGNLVVYDRQGATDTVPPKAIWQSGVTDKPGSVLRLNADGNLMSYQATSERGQFYGSWNSATPLADANGEVFLKMQDDGNLTVNRGTGGADNRGAVWGSMQSAGAVMQPTGSGVRQRFEDATPFDEAQAGRKALVVGDFRGAGVQDVVFKNTLYLNNGRGGFDTKVSLLDPQQTIVPVSKPAAAPAAFAPADGTASIDAALTTSGARDQVRRLPGDAGVEVELGHQDLTDIKLDDTTVGTTRERGSELPSNQVLVAGQTMTSDNGRYQLRMEQGGNLALYDLDAAPAEGGAPAPVWQSATGGSDSAAMLVGGDGNLSLWRPGVQAGKFANTWSGNSSQAEKDGQFFLKVQDDGALSMNRGTGSHDAQGARWSSTQGAGTAATAQASGIKLRLDDASPFDEAAAGRKALLVGDFRGTGVNDIVFKNTLYLNDGNGRFDAKVDLRDPALTVQPMVPTAAVQAPAPAPAPAGQDAAAPAQPTGPSQQQMFSGGALGSGTAQAGATEPERPGYTPYLNQATTGGRPVLSPSQERDLKVRQGFDNTRNSALEGVSGKLKQIGLEEQLLLARTRTEEAQLKPQLEALDQEEKTLQGKEKKLEADIAAYNKAIKPYENRKVTQAEANAIDAKFGPRLDALKARREELNAQWTDLNTRAKPVVTAYTNLVQGHNRQSAELVNRSEKLVSDFRSDHGWMFVMDPFDPFGTQTQGAKSPPPGAATDGLRIDSDPSHRVRGFEVPADGVTGQDLVDAVGQGRAKFGVGTVFDGSGGSGSAVNPVKGPLVVRSDELGDGQFKAPRGDNLHAGVDLAAKVGDPVLAVTKGTVAYTGFVPGYGNMVAVRVKVGAEDRTLIYSHLKDIGVKQGQQVAAGAAVGTVGLSGNAAGTTPHVHFEVRKNGGAVFDPATGYAAGSMIDPQVFLSSIGAQDPARAGTGVRDPFALDATALSPNVSTAFINGTGSAADGAKGGADSPLLARQAPSAARIVAQASGPWTAETAGHLRSLGFNEKVIASVAGKPIDESNLRMAYLMKERSTETVSDDLVADTLRKGLRVAGPISGVMKILKDADDYLEKSPVGGVYNAITRPIKGEPSQAPTVVPVPGQHKREVNGAPQTHYQEPTGHTAPGREPVTVDSGAYDTPQGSGGDYGSAPQEPVRSPAQRERDRGNAARLTLKNGAYEIVRLKGSNTTVVIDERGAEHPFIGNPTNAQIATAMGRKGSSSGAAQPVKMPVQQAKLEPPKQTNILSQALDQAKKIPGLGGVIDNLSANPQVRQVAALPGQAARALNDNIVQPVNQNFVQPIVRAATNPQQTLNDIASGAGQLGNAIKQSPVGQTVGNIGTGIKNLLVESGPQAPLSPRAIRDNEVSKRENNKLLEAAGVRPPSKSLPPEDLFALNQAGISNPKPIASVNVGQVTGGGRQLPSADAYRLDNGSVMGSVRVSESEFVTVTAKNEAELPVALTNAVTQRDLRATSKPAGTIDVVLPPSARPVDNALQKVDYFDNPDGSVTGLVPDAQGVLKPVRAADRKELERLAQTQAGAFERIGPADVPVMQIEVTRPDGLKNNGGQDQLVDVYRTPAGLLKAEMKDRGGFTVYATGWNVQEVRENLRFKLTESEELARAADAMGPGGSARNGTSKVEREATKAKGDALLADINKKWGWGLPGATEQPVDKIGAGIQVPRSNFGGGLSLGAADGDNAFERLTQQPKLFDTNATMPAGVGTNGLSRQTRAALEKSGVNLPLVDAVTSLPLSDVKGPLDDSKFVGPMTVPLDDRIGDGVGRKAEFSVYQRPNGEFAAQPKGGDGLTKVVTAPTKEALYYTLAQGVKRQQILGVTSERDTQRIESMSPGQKNLEAATSGFKTAVAGTLTPLAGGLKMFGISGPSDNLKQGQLDIESYSLDQGVKPDDPVKLLTQTATNAALAYGSGFGTFKALGALTRGQDALRFGIKAVGIPTATKFAVNQHNNVPLQNTLRDLTLELPANLIFERWFPNRAVAQGIAGAGLDAVKNRVFEGKSTSAYEFFDGAFVGTFGEKGADVGGAAGNGSTADATGVRTRSTAQAQALDSLSDFVFPDADAAQQARGKLTDLIAQQPEGERGNLDNLAPMVAGSSGGRKADGGAPADGVRVTDVVKAPERVKQAQQFGPGTLSSAVARDSDVARQGMALELEDLLARMTAGQQVEFMSRVQTKLGSQGSAVQSLLDAGSVEQMRAVLSIGREVVGNQPSDRQDPIDSDLLGGNNESPELDRQLSTAKRILGVSLPDTPSAIPQDTALPNQAFAEKNQLVGRYLQLANELKELDPRIQLQALQQGFHSPPLLQAAEDLHPMYLSDAPLSSAVGDAAKGRTLVLYTGSSEADLQALSSRPDIVLQRVSGRNDPEALDALLARSDIGSFDRIIPVGGAGVKDLTVTLLAVGRGNPQEVRGRLARGVDDDTVMSLVSRARNQLQSDIDYVSVPTALSTTAPATRFAVFKPDLVVIADRPAYTVVPMDKLASTPPEQLRSFTAAGLTDYFAGLSYALGRGLAEGQTDGLAAIQEHAPAANEVFNWFQQWYQGFDRQALSVAALAAGEYATNAAPPVGWEHNLFDASEGVKPVPEAPGQRVRWPQHGEWVGLGTALQSYMFGRITGDDRAYQGIRSLYERLGLSLTREGLARLGVTPAQMSQAIERSLEIVNARPNIARQYLTAADGNIDREAVGRLVDEVFTSSTVGAMGRPPANERLTVEQKRQELDGLLGLMTQEQRAEYEEALSSQNTMDFVDPLGNGESPELGQELSTAQGVPAGAQVIVSKPTVEPANRNSILRAIDAERGAALTSFERAVVRSRLEHGYTFSFNESGQTPTATVTLVPDVQVSGMGAVTIEHGSAGSRTRQLVDMAVKTAQRLGMTGVRMPDGVAVDPATWVPQSTAVPVTVTPTRAWKPSGMSFSEAVQKAMDDANAQALGPDLSSGDIAEQDEPGGSLVVRDAPGALAPILQPDRRGALVPSDRSNPREPRTIIESTGVLDFDPPGALVPTHRSDPSEARTIVESVGRLQTAADSIDVSSGAASMPPSDIGTQDTEAPQTVRLNPQNLKPLVTIFGAGFVPPEENYGGQIPKLELPTRVDEPDRGDVGEGPANAAARSPNDRPSVLRGSALDPIELATQSKAITSTPDRVLIWLADPQNTEAREAARRLETSLLQQGIDTVRVLPGDETRLGELTTSNTLFVPMIDQLRGRVSVRGGSLEPQEVVAAWKQGFGGKAPAAVLCVAGNAQTAQVGNSSGLGAGIARELNAPTIDFRGPITIGPEARLVRMGSGSGTTDAYLHQPDSEVGVRVGRIGRNLTQPRDNAIGAEQPSNVTPGPRMDPSRAVSLLTQALAAHPGFPDTQGYASEAEAARAIGLVLASFNALQQPANGAVELTGTIFVHKTPQGTRYFASYPSLADEFGVPKTTDAALQRSLPPSAVPIATVHSHPLTDATAPVPHASLDDVSNLLARARSAIPTLQSSYVVQRAPSEGGAADVMMRLDLKPQFWLTDDNNDLQRKIYNGELDPNDFVTLNHAPLQEQGQGGTSRLPMNVLQWDRQSQEFVSYLRPENVNGGSAETPYRLLWEQPSAAAQAQPLALDLRSVGVQGDFLALERALRFVGGALPFEGVRVRRPWDGGGDRPGQSFSEVPQPQQYESTQEFQADLKRWYRGVEQALGKVLMRRNDFDMTVRDGGGEWSMRETRDAMRDEYARFAAAVDVADADDRRGSRTSSARNVEVDSALENLDVVLRESGDRYKMFTRSLAERLARAVTTAAQNDGVTPQQWLSRQDPGWLAGYNSVLDRLRSAHAAYRRTSNEWRRLPMIQPQVSSDASVVVSSSSEGLSMTTAAAADLMQALSAQDPDRRQIGESYRKLLEAMQREMPGSGSVVRRLAERDPVLYATVFDLMREADRAASVPSRLDRIRTRLERQGTSPSE